MVKTEFISTYLIGRTADLLPNHSIKSHHIIYPFVTSILYILNSDQHS